MVNLIEFINSYDTENYVRWIVKNRFRLAFVIAFGFLTASISSIPYINLIISRSIASFVTLVLFVILFKTRYITLFKAVFPLLLGCAIMITVRDYYYAEILGEYIFFLVLVGFVMFFWKNIKAQK